MVEGDVDEGEEREGRGQRNEVEWGRDAYEKTREGKEVMCVYGLRGGKEEEGGGGDEGGGQGS